MYVPTSEYRTSKIEHLLKLEDTVSILDALVDEAEELVLSFILYLVFYFFHPRLSFGLLQ